MKFLCDEMLKGLARWLRVAGYDTLMAEPGEPDAALLAKAIQDGRLLLTRDRQLLQHRGAAGTVVLLEQNGLHALAAEVAEKLSIDWRYRPFSRCLVCNSLLEPAPPARWAETPPEAQALGGPLLQCPGCSRLYWEGSHVRRMRARLARWQGDSPDANPPNPV